MKKEDETIKYCHTLIARTREKYSSIKSVHCPPLKTRVVFNSIGFHHLRYKPNGTARNTKEVIYKMTLFPLAIAVLKKAKKVTEERRIIFKVGRKKRSQSKEAIMYALTACVGKKNTSVKVIVLRVGEGKYVFYSIMKN